MIELVVVLRATSFFIKEYETIVKRGFWKMKKKLGIVFLALVLMLTLITGCGKKTEEVVPYNYDLTEYVKIPDYHDLPFMTKTAEITDEDVENEIQSLLEYASTVENSTTGVVEDGDTINIAFAGKIDGELFEGGSSESYDLTVGTTSMIDGFVEGLIGKNVGETVTLDLQFPEEYHSAEVAGKPVVFEVTINSKKIVTKPEFNDAFVQANSEFQTTDEFRTNLKETLTKQAQDSLDAGVKDALWSVILTGSEAVQYPEEEYATATTAADEMEAEYRNQATLYGMEWEQFLQLLMGTDEAGFAEMKEEYAKNMVLSDMVLYKMARDEGVTVSQSEFEGKVKEILAANNFTEESFQSSYGTTIYEFAENNGWKTSFLLERLMDKVIEYGHEVSEEEFNEYVDHALGREHDHDHENEEAEEGEEVEEGSEGEGEASETEEGAAETEEGSSETEEGASEEGSEQSEGEGNGGN